MMTIILVQISYASTSVTIRDSVFFPPLIRVGPNFRFIAPAITSFISMYEWKQVELFAQSSNTNTFQVILHNNLHFIALIWS